ncbi:MAG: PA4642 family protein [Sinobacterium sp.]|nr:PA4642 family protein [Sinobacterium sp.]
MLKKDKEKVLDEVWTLERVKSFLDLSAPAEVDADYHVLYNAYKNMRLENFEQFLGFYKEAGRNFNVADNNGKSLIDLIKEHKKSAAYADALASFL